MGNRAVIVHESTTKQNANTKVGIYLHWYGSEEDIQRFLDEAKNRKIRSFDDSYGMARLIQAIGDILTEDCLHSSFEISRNSAYETGMGVDIVSRLDCHNYDNGVYYVNDNYEIVKHTTGEELESSESDYTSAKQLVQFYETNSTGSFHTALFDAIKNADKENLERLRIAFPEFVRAYLNKEEVEIHETDDEDNDYIPNID